MKSLRTRRTTIHKASQNFLWAQELVSFQISSHFEDTFSVLYILIFFCVCQKMARTSTLKCNRLWGMTRWRLVEFWAVCLGNLSLMWFRLWFTTTSSHRSLQKAKNVSFYMTEYVISYIWPYFSVFAQTTYSTIHDNVWSIYNNRQYVKKKSDSANIIHPSLQYAVPVTKYDRKGYKARNRQLLLMANSAIIVEEAKLKQHIDYSSLKGEEGRGRENGTA